MLRPEPDCNPTKDRFWFGVITWVQKYADVGYDEHRMVSNNPLHFLPRTLYLTATPYILVRNLVGLYQGKLSRPLPEWKSRQQEGVRSGPLADFHY